MPGVADLFVSWVRHHGRSARVAELLGIDAAFVAVGRSGDRRSVPIRYARQALQTASLLRARRPRVVVAMGPPLTFVALARALHRGVFVLDAHTGAVLRNGEVRREFLALARRSDVVVVASEGLAARLATDHGVHALTVHDPVLEPQQAPASISPRTVVFPASWRADEPMDALLAAARLLPDVEIVITGRPTATDVPSNVRLSGFVDDHEYEALVSGAGAVLALTTRAQTMQRAGYEAMAYGRPLVASDTDVLREFFTAGTVFAQPTADSLAAAITDALARGADLAREMAVLREHRRVEDDRSIGVLRDAIERARG